MAPDPSSLAQEGSVFPTTLWTGLLRPIQEGGAESRDALEQLCRRYWAPLYGYTRSKGYDHHQAEEIVQELISSFIERDAFLRVDRQNGRFRSFLLACLKNFLINRQEKLHAQKRGGGQEICPLDLVNESSIVSQEPALLAYDRAWALEVFHASLQQVEAEYRVAGKQGLFDSLKPFVTGQEPRPDREALARKHGMEVGNLDVAVYRLRRRFGLVMRGMVAQTVREPESVDEELEYLIKILSE